MASHAVIFARASARSASDEDAPAVAEVVDIVDKPAGRVVHLRILPGQLEDYQAVIQRAVISA